MIGGREDTGEVWQGGRPPLTTLLVIMVSRRVTVTAVVVVAVVVVAAAELAMAMDDAESRLDDGNSTITDENINELVDVIVDGISDELGLGDEGPPAPTPSSTIGSLFYSTVGFMLGGMLLFVSLFDATRLPVIQFFDKVFGLRQVRRRREASTGLEARVAAAFHAFTSAVDKMDALLRIADD